jgi:hypothetical protein
MPLAKPFSRSDVERRSMEALVDPALIEKFVARTGVTNSSERTQIEYKLSWTIKSYLARALADEQERPARKEAAVKPVRQYARGLLAQLKALPDGLRSELRAGGLEEQLAELISKADDLLPCWRKHVAAHRPFGEEDASLALRLSLIDIFTTHCPDAPEQRRRKWAAFVCREIDAPYPNEKTHRRRFMGEHKRDERHSREGLMTYVAGVIEDQLREHEARLQLSAKFSALKDHPI